MRKWSLGLLATLMCATISEMGHAKPKVETLSVMVPFASDRIDLSSQSLTTLARVTESHENKSYTVYQPFLRQSSQYQNLLHMVRTYRILEHLLRSGVDAQQIRVKKVPSRARFIRVSASSVWKASHQLAAPTVAADDLLDKDSLDIFYSKASSEVSSQGKKNLQQVAAEVAAGRMESLVIHGHTDRQGPARNNKLLAEVRALRVFSTLTLLGVDPQIMQVESFGAERAKAINSKHERRVSVTWVRSAANFVRVEEPPAKQEPEEEIKQVKSVANDAPVKNHDLGVVLGSAIAGGFLKDYLHRMTPTLGAQYGYVFSRALGEMRLRLWGQMPASIEVKRDDRKGDVSLWAATVGGEWAYNLRLFQPYVGLHLGSARWDASLTKPSTSQAKEEGAYQPSLRWNLGVRAKDILWNRVSLGLETQGFAMKGPFSTLLFNVGAVVSYSF